MDFCKHFQLGSCLLEDDTVAIFGEVAQGFIVQYFRPNGQVEEGVTGLYASPSEDHQCTSDSPHAKIYEYDLIDL
jgi:hypothetical protein